LLRYLELLLMPVASLTTTIIQYKDRGISVMNIAQKYVSFGLSGAFLLMLSACAAEIGSESWCTDMKEKATADWTVNEASDFAKHCILK
jgi:hypothetical protein